MDMNNVRIYEKIAWKYTASNYSNTTA